MTMNQNNNDATIIVFSIVRFVIIEFLIQLLYCSKEITLEQKNNLSRMIIFVMIHYLFRHNHIIQLTFFKYCVILCKLYMLLNRWMIKGRLYIERLTRRK